MVGLLKAKKTKSLKVTRKRYMTKQEYIFKPNCKLSFYYSGKPERYDAYLEFRQFDTTLIARIGDKEFETYIQDGNLEASNALSLRYKEDTLYLHRDQLKSTNWVGRIVDINGSWSLVTIEMTGNEF